METTKKIYNIHVRTSQDTYNKWLDIADHLDGKTQSAVFRNLINKIHAIILEIYNIKQYEATKEN